MNHPTAIIVLLCVLAFAVYRVLTRPETGAFGQYEEEMKKRKDANRGNQKPNC